MTDCMCPIAYTIRVARKRKKPNITGKRVESDYMLTIYKYKLIRKSKGLMHCPFGNLCVRADKNLYPECEQEFPVGIYYLRTSAERRKKERRMGVLRLSDHVTKHETFDKVVFKTTHA